MMEYTYTVSVHALIQTSQISIQFVMKDHSLDTSCDLVSDAPTGTQIMGLVSFPSCGTSHCNKAATGHHYRTLVDLQQT